MVHPVPSWILCKFDPFGPMITPILRDSTCTETFVAPLADDPESFEDLFLLQEQQFWFWHAFVKHDQLFVCICDLALQAVGERVVCLANLRLPMLFFWEKRCRMGRGGHCLVCDEIDNGGICGVPHCRNNRGGGFKNGPGHGLFVERPKIFNASASSGNNHHVAMPMGVTMGDGVRDFCRRAFALYPCGREYDPKSGPSFLKNPEHISEGGPLRWL